jgi:hypothetical protein
VHSNFIPVRIRKLIEYAVVQINERVQQSLGGVEFERQASFRKIDLHARGIGFQTLPDISRRILNEIFQESLVRISVQAALRIEQAQSGCRNHSLFPWPASMSLSGLKVGDGVDAIAERTFRQSRQLPGVAISKWNGHAIRSEILQTAKGIGCKTRLGLLTVRDDGRSGCFQAANSIA